MVSAAVAAIGLSGCQSWGPNAFPMNSMSRVSPPGTGTYTVPNGYYNQTSSLGNAPPGMTASQGNPQLTPIQGGLPTTSLANNGPNGGGVVPAQFTSNSAALQSGQFQPPTATQPLGAPVTGGVSTAQFTNQTFTNQPSAASPNQNGNYQSGNYETRDISGSASGTFSDAPDVAADPELQWRP